MFFRTTTVTVAALFFISFIFTGSGVSFAKNATDAQERIDFIQKSLDNETTYSQAWWYGWMGGYALLAGGQYTLGAVKLDDNKEYVSWMVGAAKSTLALGMLAALPFKPAYAASRLMKTPYDNPDETPDEKLARAETWLRLCAKKERKGRAWYKHLLIFAVNAIGAGVVWPYQGWAKALISFGSGFAVSEANVLSQPTQAMQDWKEYRRKYIDRVKTSFRDEDEKMFFFTVYPGGASAGIRF